ncbi:50S ribosomal protein L21 [Megalodesulfovibrio gigas]|uniref:Large ribosomal subunit protein bL21 n=1 Tax=Megalodesulfovibrio gigas (strain ATCC 19364 / DSM 1382 / NCIMB 9332 / VKM B-1759) TaxID=1121448 RepID=T2G7X6_MEGG1|nr:50S ribosomal protein L21 [Megalodesulfovibrio gigas]AGW12289.1 putative 50S ribosomal protein L21 [Megalodesulfovibrio gigas DSM 1382 = ATCC 19364]
MFAIIECSGKQYKVQEGTLVDVDLLAAEPGQEVKLDKVLMLSGDETKVGDPYVDGVTVSCEVVEHYRDKKVVVFKKWRRNDSRKKQGHRQSYTTLRVTSIA